MVKTRSRSLAAIAAGALLLAPLAGCGGSDDKKSGDDAKASSSSSSSTSPGVGETSSDDATEPGSSSGGKEVDTADFIETVLDAMKEKKTAHMVIELGSSMTANADFRYGEDNVPEMRMKSTMGSTNIEIILVGGAMYMQQPGGKYLKIDKDDPAMGSLLDQFSALGPQSSVTAMREGIEKIVDLGSAKIDGEELDKYELTVDTKAVAEQLGEAATAADLPKTVVYTMYLDDDDLMRRVDMEVSGQKIVMKVSDWGEPVDIKAPPASKIVKQ